MPENKENFWNIVKNGVKISVIDVQNSPILNENQKKVYKVMAYKTLSQISKYKDSVDDVDLNDYNNLKAFLYFEIQDDEGGGGERRRSSACAKG